ncbi:MAG TPA: DUF2382 domain-containing protein [Cyanophyceae cyanobacterium]
MNTHELIDNQSRVKDLLEKLKKKLLGFTVINLEGQPIGRITDFILNKMRRLYLVVSPSDAQVDSHRILLSSKYIQKIDTFNRVLFINLSLQEIGDLPIYPSSNNQATEMESRSSSASISQPIHASTTDNLVESQNLNTANLMDEMDVDDEDVQQSDDSPEIVEEEIVRLLEERLVVNRHKRKVGEIVVRKEIETRIVEVPIQREKLIIEQVGSETKTLAEIDLGQGEVTGVELASTSSSHTIQESLENLDKGYRVIGEFVSPKAASDLLHAIALHKPHGCERVRVELILDNPEAQDTYQKMFDRCAIG